MLHPFSLSFIHKFLLSVLEGLPGKGEVEHAAEADPEGLRAGRWFSGAVVVASQFGNQRCERL